MKSIWSKIRKLESQSYSTRIDRRKERKCTQRDLPKSLWISRTQIRLVLTFLRSFLPTLILEFSGSLLPILTSSAMQLIATTSPLPTVQMAATYRPIYVLKRCRKSGGTLQTCPDLPAIISRNFDFRVFELIFYDFWVLAPQSCNFHWHFGISMGEKNLSSIVSNATFKKLSTQ